MSWIFTNIGGGEAEIDEINGFENIIFIPKHSKYLVISATGFRYFLLWVPGQLFSVNFWSTKAERERIKILFTRSALFDQKFAKNYSWHPE